jgi:hypothetical protein
MSSRIEQALLSKISKVKRTSSRIGKLKFLEYASSILDSFILPYIISYCTYADLKSLNIEKCKPNHGLIDVLEQFLQVASANDKIKHRVNDNIWKQIVKVAL